MRIFIDSNVLISALVFDGNELNLIFSSMNMGHTLVISEHIEEEVFRTMLEKFPEHSKIMHEFINLASFEIFAKEKYQDNINNFDIVRDRHDRHVLASAASAKCDMIVTGDKDLLILKMSQNMKILTSKEALKLIRAPARY